MAVRYWYNSPHEEHRSSKHAAPHVCSNSPACSIACPRKNVRPLQLQCLLWPMQSNWVERTNSHCTRLFLPASNSICKHQKKRNELCLQASKEPLRQAPRFHFNPPGYTFRRSEERTCVHD